MPSLLEMLASGSEPERKKTSRDWLVDQIKEHEERVRVYKKALTELDAIGHQRLDRVIGMMRDAEDPDVTKPVLKVGPHGPGCECADDEGNEKHERAN